MQDAARAYDKATTSAGALNGAFHSVTGALSMLSDITGNTRFGNLISDVDHVARKFGGIGMAAGGAILGFTAVAAGAVALGSSLYDLGKRWDDVSDSITARTGKIGGELDAVVNQVERAAYSTAATTSELGTIAGSVVQSLRLSGDQIGTMTNKIAELNNLTGDQVNIRQLGEVYRVFGVDAGDQVGVLQQLYGIFQDTGVPVNELIETLQKSGSVLSEFGMDFTQAAGFVTVFQNAGISADSAIKGLKFSLKNLAEAGVDPQQGLRQIITEIQNLIDSGDDLGARDLAEQRFGKGFPEILRAIKDNRIELEALPSAIDPISDKIGEATRSTEDFTEKWQKFKNIFEIGLKPAAAGFFDFLNDRMEQSLDYMQTKVQDTVEAWTGLFNGSFWNDSALGKLLSKMGFGPGDDGSWTGGGGSFDNGAASGQSARDFAHSTKIPFWESQGFTVGDHAADQFGEHQNGAVDVMVPSIAAGQKVLEQALKDPSVYGAIFNNQTFGYGNGLQPRDYTAGHTGNPTQDHQDHVHIWYKPGGANNIPAGMDALGSAAIDGVLGGAAFGAGTDQMPAMPGAAAPVGPATKPAAPTLTPGLVAPTAPSTPFTPSNFPAAGDVAAASPNTTQTQMVPSPFGAGYQPVPAGSTAGYNQFGKPGFYLPDPKQIENSTRTYENAVENATESAKAIQEAKARQAEAAQEAAKVEQDLYSTAEDRKRAQDKVTAANQAVERAVKAADRANESAEQAEEQLAEAKRGSFREAQKAAEAKQRKKGGVDELGFPLADDFGISEGLPGIAKWLTTFAANLAFAPMNGALGAVAGGGPGQTGYGMLGMMGANNVASGLSPLGLYSSGSSGGGMSMPSFAMPGMSGFGSPAGGPATGNSSSPVPGAMGPAPLGGSLGSVLPGMPSVSPGPGTPQTSMAPSEGPGGGGFAGIGGLPLAAASTAISAAGLAADGAGGFGGGTAAAAAAQMAIQLANRTAGYIGQAAAIGVGGLMETFLPHNSAVADPNKSWIGRIAAGFAGARPALPNTAGGEQQPDQQQGKNPAGDSQPPQTPEEAQQQAQQQNGGRQGGAMVNVENINNYSPDGGQVVANQIGRAQMSSYASGGPR